MDTASERMTKGVTPHMMRGPDKCCLWVLQRGNLLNTELPYRMSRARSPVRPMGAFFWPGRYCRLFSLGINSGYILDTTSRTVSARTAMRGPGKRISRVNLPVFSGFRIKCGMTFADIPESRIGVRDDWETASGAIEQTKKVIIKKCGISLPKVRDDLCRYSLDPASERGMTG